MLADLGGLRPGLQAHAVERAGGRRGQGPAGHGRRDRRRGPRSRQAVLDAPRSSSRSTAPSLRFTKADAARIRSAGPVGLRGCTTRPGRPPRGRSSSWWPASTPTSWARTCWAGRTCSTRATSPRCAGRSPPSPRCTRLIDRLWPRLTAERLLRDLFASRRAARRGRARAGARPSGTCCSAPPSAPWTPADVPLLEEADELLGVDESAQRRGRARDQQQRRRRDAQETLDLLHGSRSTDARPRTRPRSSAPATCSTPRAWPSARRTPTTADHGRARRGRPHLDLRARDRRRGAGALGDGLAAADAPLPHPVDDRRRRRRPDRLAGRGDELGRGARPAPRPRAGGSRS